MRVSPSPKVGSIVGDCSIAASAAFCRRPRSRGPAPRACQSRHTFDDGIPDEAAAVTAAKNAGSAIAARTGAVGKKLGSPLAARRRRRGDTSESDANPAEGDSDAEGSPD